MSSTEAYNIALAMQKAHIWQQGRQEVEQQQQRIYQSQTWTYLSSVPAGMVV